MTDHAQVDRFDRFLLVLRQALLLIVKWIERELKLRGTAASRYQESADDDRPAWENAS